MHGRDANARDPNPRTSTCNHRQRTGELLLLRARSYIRATVLRAYVQVHYIKLRIRFALQSEWSRRQDRDSKESPAPKKKKGGKTKIRCPDDINRAAGRRSSAEVQIRARRKLLQWCGSKCTTRLGWCICVWGVMCYYDKK